MNSVDFYLHLIMNKTLDFHLKDKISIFILLLFGSVSNETQVN